MEFRIAIAEKFNLKFGKKSLSFDSKIDFTVEFRSKGLVQKATSLNGLPFLVYF